MASSAGLTHASVCTTSLVNRLNSCRISPAHTRGLSSSNSKWRVNCRGLSQQSPLTLKQQRPSPVPLVRAKAENVSREVAVEHLQESQARTIPNSSRPSGDQAAVPVKELLLLSAASGMGLLLPGFDVEGSLSVLEAIGVLALIVAVHEAGHFAAARLQGIRVSKFCIGFGPIIFKYQSPASASTASATSAAATAASTSAPGGSEDESKISKLFGGLKWGSSKDEKEKAAAAAAAAAAASAVEANTVEYSLRAIPLGGYVAFPDPTEDPEVNIPVDDPDLLKNRPILDRAIVISAGVIANLVFAYALLFTQVNTVGIIQQRPLGGVEIPHVVPGSAGDRSGLRDGDIVIAVAGRTLPASESAVGDLVATIKASAGAPVDLLVQRGGEEVTVNVRPALSSDGSGRIGVELAPHAEQVNIRASNPIQALSLAGAELVRLGSLVVDGLNQLVSDFGRASERLSGPVAIVAVGAEVARTSAPALFQFAAIVNLNLAVVNALPLPALDGGFLALLLVEGVRGGKKLPDEAEKAIMSSGLLALLTAGVFLIVRDTANLGIFSFLSALL